MMKGFKIYIDFLTKTTNYYILVGDYRPTFKLIIMIIIYFHIKLNILFLEPNPYQ